MSAPLDRFSSTPSDYSEEEIERSESIGEWRGDSDREEPTETGDDNE